MQVLSFEHNAALALSDPRIAKIVARIIHCLREVPVPYWPGKSEKQANKSILQPMLNAFIEQEFLAIGAGKELRITGDVDDSGGMRLDFFWEVDGKLVAVEVQFGNVGRVYSDFIKFQHLYTDGEPGRLALGISISLTNNTAQLTDSGISTHENSIRRINDFRNSIFRANPLPLLCLGLNHENSTLIDLSSSKYPGARIFEGAGAKALMHQTVAQLRSGMPVEEVGCSTMVQTSLKSFSHLSQNALF